MASAIKQNGEGSNDLKGALPVAVCLPGLKKPESNCYALACTQQVTNTTVKIKCKTK